MRGRHTGVVCLTLLLCQLLAACNGEETESHLTPEEQYEVTLERRSELGKFEEDLVDAIGGSAWDAGLPTGKAQTAGCPSGVPDEFLFKRRRNTPRQSFPFQSVGERSDAIASAKAHLGKLGMETRVEQRNGEVYLYGDGSDLSALIMFLENGAALMTVETSCSTEWPDFTLTLTQFAELENDNARTE